MGKVLSNELSWTWTGLVVACLNSDHIFFQGTTSYYSSNCDQKDAELAQEFMNSKVSGYVLVTLGDCVHLKGKLL